MCLCYSYFGLGCRRVPFLEKAARSVGCVFSLLYFWLFVVLVVSRFGFEGWIYVLIASGPGLCMPFTFNRRT